MLCRGADTRPCVGGADYGRSGERGGSFGGTGYGKPYRPVAEITIDPESGDLSQPLDTEIDMDEVRKLPQPSPLGAGFVILVTRELTGLTQREVAARVGTSQPNLASLESGNRMPTGRTLLRIAVATGFDLVIGLRRPDRPRPDPRQIRELGFDLLGILKHDPQDDLADFDVLREPSPLEGPKDDPPEPADAEVSR
jgi:transcriptional regulator with XRE-family HTH domain